MSAKTSILQAREAMAAVLDAKLANLPEWKAFRDIDRALLELDAEQPVSPAPRERSRITPAGEAPSYVKLALQAFDEVGTPVPTPKLMQFVGSRRELPADPERAKVNVTSSLSKEKRIKSVPWEGGRAWWYADRPVPKKDLL
jgi:hypothetical protein